MKTKKATTNDKWENEKIIVFLRSPKGLRKIPRLYASETSGKGLIFANS